MKELTTEQKAQRYDGAIKKAKYYYDEGKTLEYANDIVSDIFPELKESEDERIRGAIIDHLKDNNLTEWAAWLEAQGEHANFINKIQIGDKVTRNEDGVLVNLSQLNRVAKKDEKQGEQKSADETKFKVGDWVVYCNDDVDLITGIEENGYCINNGGYIPFVCESDIRLWTIQDAKDGDVLCTKNKCCPFIYDKGRYNNGLAYYYAGIDVSGNLNIKSPHNMLAHFGRLDNIRPATKEQRDTLEKAMADAGYTFDFEKKELKKIEQKPTWSEEDEEIYRKCICAMRASACGFPEEEKFVEQVDNWLKSIKDRVQPKQGWSEEDEDVLDALIRKIEGEDIHVSPHLAVKCLKSLKERYTWKPSEEQMNTLEYYMHTLVCNKHKEILFGLYADLKKLRED